MTFGADHAWTPLWTDIQDKKIKTHTQKTPTQANKQINTYTKMFQKQRNYVYAISMENVFCTNFLLL